MSGFCVLRDALLSQQYTALPAQEAHLSFSVLYFIGVHYAGVIDPVVIVNLQLPPLPGDGAGNTGSKPQLSKHTRLVFLVWPAST